MRKGQNNYAYIDGANLHNAVKNFSWDFDYGRFRVWLEDKYFVKQAYIFLGFIPRHTALYVQLWKQGYSLVFKEVVYSQERKPKGNCDADLIVRAMIDTYEKNYDKAVLVSSDGDFSPLVKFLDKRNIIQTILSPYSIAKCSILLKRTGVKISCISNQKRILIDKKEKAPDADFPA